MKKFLQILQVATIAFVVGFLFGYDRGHEIGFSGVITEITEAEEFAREFEIPPPDYAIDEPVTDEEIDKLLEEFLGEEFFAPDTEEPEFYIEDYFINKEEFIEANLSKEAKCLAQNIYFEARNQKVSGRLAVAMVTLYRVKSKSYPNTICNVVWQKAKTKQGKMVAQFSWTLDGLSDIPREKKAWKSAQVAAIWILAYKDVLIKMNYLDGAMHYHATYVTPKWDWSKLTLVRQMDTHKFYRLAVAKN